MTKLPKPFCSETLLLGYTIAILYSSLCCQVSKCGRVLPGQVLQSRIFMMRVWGRFALTALLALAAVTGFGFRAQAADPIKIGFSMSLTGGLASGGKPSLLAMQPLADMLANAALLGRSNRARLRFVGSGGGDGGPPAAVTDAGRAPSMA